MVFHALINPERSQNVSRLLFGSVAVNKWFLLRTDTDSSQALCDPIHQNSFLVLQTVLLSEGQLDRNQNMCPVCDITSSPSGVDSILHDVLWDSRPLRLSTVCHFLTGIHGLVISLPIVLARQWPTWPHLFFVHGCFYGPGCVMISMSIPVKNIIFFAFLFPLPFNCWKIKL